MFVYLFSYLNKCSLREIKRLWQLSNNMNYKSDWASRNILIVELCKSILSIKKLDDHCVVCNKVNTLLKKKKEKWACCIIPPVKALMFTVCLWNWKVHREAPVRKRYLREGSLGSLPRVRSMEASRGEGSRLRHDARDWLESSREAIIANQGGKKAYG